MRCTMHRCFSQLLRTPKPWPHRNASTRDLEAPDCNQPRLPSESGPLNTARPPLEWNHSGPRSTETRCCLSNLATVPRVHWQRSRDQNVTSSLYTGASRRKHAARVGKFGFSATVSDRWNSWPDGSLQQTPWTEARQHRHRLPCVHPSPRATKDHSRPPLSGGRP